MTERNLSDPCWRFEYIAGALVCMQPLTTFEHAMRGSDEGAWFPIDTGFRSVDGRTILVDDPVAYRRAARCDLRRAAFKRNVPVAYAWEPVLVKAARKPVVSKRLTMRDWIDTDIQESITLRRGLTGAKPESVCHWAFELMGARPDDDLDDLFPGTGAVTNAWKTWCGKFTLPEDER